jgi:hypothetical protein
METLDNLKNAVYGLKRVLSIVTIITLSAVETTIYPHPIILYKSIGEGHFLGVAIISIRLSIEIR